MGKVLMGVISLERIADTIFSMSNPDVICLQEVSRNCNLKMELQPDQLKQLSNIFKAMTPFFGPAYDVLKAMERAKESSSEISYFQNYQSYLTFNHIFLNRR